MRYNVLKGIAKENTVSCNTANNEPQLWLHDITCVCVDVTHTRRAHKIIPFFEYIYRFQIYSKKIGNTA